MNLYTLESGITGNSNKEWFDANPYFTVKIDDNNRMAFINPAGIYEIEHLGKDKPSIKNCVISSPAKFVERSDDRHYMLYRDEDGNKYPLWKCGTIA